MILTLVLLKTIKKQAEDDQAIWDGLPGNTRQEKINNLDEVLNRNGANKNVPVVYFEHALAEYRESAACEILDAIGEWSVLPYFTEGEKNNIAPVYNMRERAALADDFENYQMFRRLQRIERRGA